MLVALLLTQLIWNKIVPHKMELKSILRPVNIPPYMEHKRTILYGTFLIHILWNCLETHNMELNTPSYFTKHPPLSCFCGALVKYIGFLLA